MSSRVAKKPVQLPTSVQLLVEANTVTVKGPKGSITNHIHKFVKVNHDKENNLITFSAASNDPKAWAHAGTARANVNNMIVGVQDGFTVVLELHGVGYRAQASGNTINLSLGYSHPVVYKLPQGVSAETPSPVAIILRGIDKQQLGQVAAEIRSYRPPEPYKGKGCRYANEKVARKEAKKK